MGEGAREVSGERACFDTVSLSAAEHIACNVRASGRADEENGRDACLRFGVVRTTDDRGTERGRKTARCAEAGLNEQ